MIIFSVMVDRSMVEFIAETEANVLAIDFNIENAGSTLLRHGRRRSGLHSVKTIYDHIEPHSKPAKNFTDNTQVDERLWRVPTARTS